MSFRTIALFVLVFSLGVVSASLVYEFGKITLQSPSAVIANPINTVTETFAAARNGIGIERVSPGDHIKEDQIKVFDDKIELNIPHAVWSRFSNTNSMDPFLDEGSNGLEIIPASEDQIQVGDIISYQLKEDVIIHRVIKIDHDENGTFYIVKGDNNPVQDPGKVRFNQIKGILIGIIY